METLLLDPPGAYVRYLDFPGEELPLVFLHGLGCAASSDFPRVAANPVLAGHRSLLIDFFGHGYSDGPGDFGYALEDHAGTVWQLLDHLSLKGCAVFGHSMGGAVAITLAALRPDLVSRLILAEGNLDPGGGSISKSIAAQSEHEFQARGHQALLERLPAVGFITSVGPFRVCAPHGLYRSAVGLSKGTHPTMRERLYGLRMPRAYLFGEQSLPDPETERLASHGIRVVVIPKAGHAMALDNPAGVARAIRQTLDVPAASV
jgi:pimeloyl-ACP methyl ester carboxylesterase